MPVSRPVPLIELVAAAYAHKLSKEEELDAASYRWGAQTAQGDARLTQVRVLKNADPLSDSRIPSSTRAKARRRIEERKRLLNLVHEGVETADDIRRVDMELFHILVEHAAEARSQILEREVSERFFRRQGKALIRPHVWDHLVAELGKAAPLLLDNQEIDENPYETYVADFAARVNLGESVGTDPLAVRLDKLTREGYVDVLLASIREHCHPTEVAEFEEHLDALSCSGAGQAGNAAKGGKRGRQLKWLAEAMLLVRDHPDWSDAEIARRVRKDKSTLSRSPEYQRAAAVARGEKGDLPSGHVKLDSETGLTDVEAYASENDSDDA